MKDSLSTISTTPDFVPVSFNVSIGANTFIEGHFLVMALLFVYSRFKKNYALALKVANTIFLLALTWSIILALQKVFQAFYGDSLVYQSYALVGYPALFVGLICFCANVSLFVKKLRENINYSFAVACINVLLSFLWSYYHLALVEFSDYLPASKRNMYPFVWDQLEAGITFLIILLTILLLIKLYNTLKLRLSPHK